jgi:rRNA maturation endonuclease Nob1
MRAGEESGEPLGGDPVCWADRVCAACGRLNTGSDEPETCERCGAELRQY